MRERHTDTKRRGVWFYYTKHTRTYAHTEREREVEESPEREQGAVEKGHRRMSNEGGDIAVGVAAAASKISRSAPRKPSIHVHAVSVGTVELIGEFF